MMPTWATVVVGLGAGIAAGVVSGLGAAMLRDRYDRAAELRMRMFNVADDFTVAVVAARQRMRTAAGEVLRRPRSPFIDPATDWYTSDFERELNEVNALIDDAIAKSARIYLLFGDRSEAGVDATAMVEHLQGMDMALNERPDSLRNTDAMAKYSLKHERGTTSQEAFNRAARLAIRGVHRVGAPREY